MTQVLVVAASSVQRHLIASLLEHDADFKVVGQADDGAEAVELADRLQPDLIAMDLYLPVLDAVSATRQIMDRAPTRIVILSSVDDELDLGKGAEALQAGAVMVVPKPGSADGPEFEMRRRMFMEMVRSANRRPVEPIGPRRRSASQSEPWWQHPEAFAPLVIDSSVPDFFRGAEQPFTVENRNQRIQAILDEMIEGDGWDEDGWEM